MTHDADPTPRLAEERDLIARLAGRDPNALTALYEETSGPLLGLALRIVGDREEAEEALLDVYIQVWRDPERYDSRRGSLLTWLFTLTRTRAIDRLRRSRRIASRELPIEEASAVACGRSGPEEDALLSDRRRLVREAVGRLSPDQREAIEIAYFSGLSHREIAERIGAPLGTVKTRIRQGMILLRAALESHKERI